MCTCARTPTSAELAAQLPQAPADGVDVCTAWWRTRAPDVRGALRTLALARGWMGRDTWRSLHSRLCPDDPGAAAVVDRAAAEFPGAVEHRLALPRLAALARREDDDPGERHPDGDRVFEILTGLVPPAPDGRPDWGHAPDYVPAHLLAHAPDTRAVATLLSDPGFLVHAAPEAVTRVLEDRRTVTPPSLRAAWYPAAPVLPGRRRRLRHRPAAGAAGCRCHGPGAAARRRAGDAGPRRGAAG